MEEKGEASLKIELKDKEVFVYHGTDKGLLYRSPVKKGYWDNLWDAIKKID